MEDSGPANEGAQRRGESEEEQLDRNLDELLQELRIVIPGIQFLFAFLLVVPFQQGWTTITDFEKAVYYATLLTTIGSAICFMGPTARHRIRFRGLDKRWVVEGAHRLTLAGLALFAISFTGAILLISHVVWNSGPEAAIAAAAVGLTVTTIWFIVPLRRKLTQPK